MRLNLSKRIILSLIFPCLVMSLIMVYSFQHLNMIYHKVALVEMADDINLTLLELRRYEKNTLLFQEEDSAGKFMETLSQLKTKVGVLGNEIIAETNKANYQTLVGNISAYEISASSVISSVQKEQELIEGIRPFGRDIENQAQDKELALELRRQEKNFIIYKEQKAVDKVHSVAMELARMQPALAAVIESYVNVFDSLIENDSLHGRTLKTMRLYARGIEEQLREFSRKEREEIDKIILTAKKLFFASVIFLIIVTAVIGYLISKNMIRHLKKVEDCLDRLKRGDYNHSIDPDKAPQEIGSLMYAYNTTVKKLRESRTELEHTLRKLEETNKELVERQDELVEARKLTAMRLLASEIAHEINNPLSSVITFLGMFYEDLKDDDSKKETIDLMLKEANRCRVVLRELVDFAKKEPLSIRDVSPAKLIQEAIEVVNKQHREKNIHLTCSFNGLPEKATLDPILVHQALVNILANAYQFTQTGGDIDIRGSREDNRMILVIRDKGTGISEKNLPYIFEPFFSTRKEIGGSGLGLALTKKIIERHKGSIHVQSRFGEETVFTIQLPIHQE